MAAIDLGNADLRAVLDFASTTQVYGWSDAHAELILKALAGLIPCDFVTVTHITPHAASSWLRANPPDAISPPVFEAFTRHADEHPYVRYHEASGLTEVSRTSDLVSLRDWRSGPLYAEHFKPLSVRHQLCSLLAAPHGAMVGLALNRSGADFSDRDRDVLDVAQTYVAATFLNYQRIVDLERRLSLLSGASSTSPDVAQHEGLTRLTAREQEVAGLLSLGLADKQIARRLLISDRTVHKHVEHILAKLRLPNRAAVARMLTSIGG